MDCRRLWVLIQALPIGARSRTGLEHEWLLEHELVATLLEIEGNRGRKKGSPHRITRPGPRKVAETKPRLKEEAVERARGRMLSIARLGGGA